MIRRRIAAQYDLLIPNYYASRTTPPSHMAIYSVALGQGPVKKFHLTCVEITCLLAYKFWLDHFCRSLIRVELFRRCYTKYAHVKRVQQHVYANVHVSSYVHTYMHTYIRNF